MLVVGAGERDRILRLTGLIVGGTQNSRELLARTEGLCALSGGAEQATSIARRTHRLLTPSARSLVFGNGASVPIEQLLRLCAIEAATFELRRTQPQLSAAQVITPAQRNALLAGFLTVTLAIILWPKFGTLAVVGFVATGYVANAIFRGWLFWVGAGDPPRAFAAGPDELARKLPVYTVLVPLFREANVLRQLAVSLRAMDYPRESLDIKLIIEENDNETLSAALAASTDGFFDVIVVPSGAPQTKPRACNYALQFARGEYVVIFDAEDRPEPDQLRKAVETFRNGPADVACLQARLNFFNARECWITRGMLAQREKKIVRTMHSFGAWKDSVTSTRSRRLRTNGRHSPARSRSYRPASITSAAS